MSGYSYFMNFLREEGFRFEEKETFCSFRYQGTKYVAFRNSDSKYLQLTILFYDVDASNRIRCIETANNINSEKFVVKLTVDNDSVWCNYEFIPDGQTTSEEFINILDFLQSTMNLFYEKMNA